jgi:hypothetical protein
MPRLPEPIKWAGYEAQSPKLCLIPGPFDRLRESGHCSQLRSAEVCGRQPRETPEAPGVDMI